MIVETGPDRYLTAYGGQQQISPPWNSSQVPNLAKTPSCPGTAPTKSVSEMFLNIGFFMPIRAARTIFDTFFAFVSRQKLDAGAIGLLAIHAISFGSFMQPSPIAYRSSKENDNQENVNRFHAPGRNPGRDTQWEQPRKF